MNGNKQLKLYLFLYVDDIIIVGNDIKDIDEIKGNLKNEFMMKDIGESIRILRIEIRRRRKKRLLVLS